MAVDILCMGEPMLEFNQLPPGDDGRVLFLQGHGGDTSNAAIAAARQGVSAGYVTAIGQDAAGDSFMELWRKERIDTSTVIRSAEAATAVYFVTHDAKGHHFTFYRSGSAASRYAPRDVPEEAIARARILYASGISQAISASAADAVFHAISVAKRNGVKVAYDTNLRLRLWPPARARAIIEAAIAQADMAFPSREDAEALTGLSDPDAIADHYLRLGCPLVAVKCGADGALLATAEGLRVRAPAHAVDAVDATGAGDTFCGAFLARTLLGDPPAEALRYANAAAALSTTGYGAVAPIPREAEVRALLGA
jgi:2-dehydro-3-deoxygluconokinase